MYIPYDENKKLTVINLFGGPGVGKSVTAARLFANMKTHGMKVELIHEIAKDLVWEQRYNMFGEQDYIFAHQHRLIRRLVHHDIDYAVVDSSILLTLFYMKDEFPQSFRQFVIDVFNSYNNINILLSRNPNFEYQQWGRNESEEESKVIDNTIQQYFDSSNTPYTVVQAGDEAERMILDVVLNQSR